MDEKIKMNEKNNSKNKSNKKLKTNCKYEIKKKYISQNPLLSSKNNVSTNNTYANLSKYTEPFKKNNSKKVEQDNNFQTKRNRNSNCNEIKKDMKQLQNSLKIIKDNGNIQEKDKKWSNNYISKEDDELVTSFEKNPSEIQSPETVSEGSFITELSDYHNNKNNLNNKKEEKREKTKINICKKYNKNNKINDYKIKSCKKMMPDEFYKAKFENKNELKEKSEILINEYNNKDKKPKIKNINEIYDEKDINNNKDKNNYENLFLKNVNHKNKRNNRYTSNCERNNSILNYSNIYIPVNQRKKLDTNKKYINNSKEKIIESTKNNTKKNILLNSTELMFKSNQLTKRIELNQKVKNNKNNSIEKKINNNDSLGILKKTFLNIGKNENNDDILNKLILNGNNMKNCNTLKYNRNNILKKSYLKNGDNNIDKNISILDGKFDKLNSTNINFYKNKNIRNNINKKNHKLFLSIDELNDLQNSKKLCDISKISTIKNPMIYEPKKPSMAKNKNNRQLFYNRASYDPNNSNYNLTRKKKLLKQSLTTIDLLNNKDNTNTNMKNILEKHIRNYSGIKNSESLYKNQKISEFMPNKLRNIIKNNFIINNNNSYSVDRNSINMKIINSLNRSYDNNFYPRRNNFSPSIINDKDIDWQYLLQSNNNLNNNNVNKSPNKDILKNNSYFNNTIKEDNKRKLNIYANNINNINNYLDINNPILKYNDKTNKDNNNMSQRNNINIINSNNSNNYINRERLTFFPQHRNLSLELDNQYNKINTLNINNYQNQSNLISLNNNNMLENNEIYNIRQNLNNNVNNNYFGINLNLLNYLNQQKVNSFSISMNLEDLILLLEKFNNIILNFNNKRRIVYNECFEFLNYYYNSSVYCQLEKLYMNNLDSNSIRICINYCLISIIILYDYSFEINSLKNEFVVINNILKLNYMNLMLISEHILKIISSSSNHLNNNNSLGNNFLIVKLYNIIDLFRKRGGFQNDFIEIKPYSVANDLDMSNIEKISYNTNLIIQYLRYILKNYRTSKNGILTSFFKKIKEKTYEEINLFFRDKIFRILNKNGSIFASVLFNNMKINSINNNIINKLNFRTLPAPYLRTKNNKNYSLVLDLDETLIHFKMGNTDEEGVLRIRPGITEFLEEIGNYYELILFTTATQEYADLLVDAIEEDKIYFDHRLYREHAIIIDNDFVKDLTRIGRPLDKIIIVDDMPQNFKLQKENGIIIRPFWGEDNYDMALYNLIPILKNIAKENIDVRIGLANYKDEIFKNITSGFYI